MSLEVLTLATVLEICESNCSESARKDRSCPWGSPPVLARKRRPISSTKTASHTSVYDRSTVLMAAHTEPFNGACRADRGAFSRPVRWAWRKEFDLEQNWLHKLLQRNLLWAYSAWHYSVPDEHSKTTVKSLPVVFWPWPQPEPQKSLAGVCSGTSRCPACDQKALLVKSLKWYIVLRV